MMRVTTCWNWNWNWKGTVAPFAAMVVLEFTDVGISTISKAAMTRGMSNYIFVVYYNALETSELLSLSRSSVLSSFSPLLGNIYSYTLTRCTQREFIIWKKCIIYFVLHNIKLKYLTEERIQFLLQKCGADVYIYWYQVQFSNSVIGHSKSYPGFYILACSYFQAFYVFLFVDFLENDCVEINRMESLDLRRSSSQAKCLGAIVAVSGALMVTLYKGPSIYMASVPSNFSLQLLSLSSNWVYGGFLSALGYFLGAVWYVVQAAIVKEYPEKMTIVFFYCFFVTIQCAIFTLIVERNPHAWTLTSGIEMLAILFSAIFGSVFRCGIVTWCLHKKGPFYVSMFKPLTIVIAVVMGVTFLKDTLHLGSVIGAIIITLGIYTVMWGQSKGMDNGVCSVKLSTQKTPLLQEQIEV